MEETLLTVLRDIQKDLHAWVSIKQAERDELIESRKKSDKFWDDVQKRGAERERKLREG